MAGRSTSLSSILKPTLLAATTRTWIDGEKIPATGGCVVVLNHVSHVDPLTAAHFVYDHGRLPRYLAKSGLFKNKCARRLPALRRPDPGRAAQPRTPSGPSTPPSPRSARASASSSTPRARITRDPDLWPMTGKTGAARIALATGCPVIPVGQWGAQELLPPYAKTPDLFPRKTIT